MYRVPIDYRGSYRGAGLMRGALSGMRALSSPLSLSLPLLRPLLWALSLSASLFWSAAHAQGFTEGKHYLLLDPPVPTEVPQGIVEVREFFWYACPHCFALEPHLQRWKMPKRVRMIHTPAILGERWLPHAYTYYTLDEMGLLDQMHNRFFEALHVKKLRLMTPEAITGFFVDQGVPRDKFENVYKSFSVDTRVKKAERATMNYQVRGVPMIAVNGRYVVNSKELGSYRQMIELMDYLVHRELLRIGALKKAD